MEFPACGHPTEDIDAGGGLLGFEESAGEEEMQVEESMAEEVTTKEQQAYDDVFQVIDRYGKEKKETNRCAIVALSKKSGQRLINRFFPLH